VTKCLDLWQAQKSVYTGTSALEDECTKSRYCDHINKRRQCRIIGIWSSRCSQLVGVPPSWGGQGGNPQRQKHPVQQALWKLSSRKNEKMYPLAFRQKTAHTGPLRYVSETPMHGRTLCSSCTRMTSSRSGQFYTNGVLLLSFRHSCNTHGTI